MSADQRLADLGLTLPSPPKPIGNYVPVRLAGNLLFLSGVGPRHADEKMVIGKVGETLIRTHRPVLVVAQGSLPRRWVPSSFRSGNPRSVSQCSE